MPDTFGTFKFARVERVSMRLLLALVLFTHLLAGSVHAQSKPNILFLFSDDQHAGTIGALGNSEIKTPHIDALYERGFHFRNAFCMGGLQGAVCVPSRAMLMTGKSLFRVKENLAGEKLMPTALAAAGYVTFGTGKWHNGKPSFAAAFDHGKNVFMGGMGNQAAVPVVDRNPDGTFTAPTKNDTYSSQLFADAAVAFLKNHGQRKPFLCYVSFTHPHDPRTSPPPYSTMYDPAKITLPKNYLPVHPFHNGEMVIRDEKLLPWPRTQDAVKKEIADYYACISYMDTQIGRIIETLRETKQYDNTIIVFASDHGLSIGRHGLMGKQSVYDHAMRAPLVIAGPGVNKGRSDAMCYLNDIFPTLFDLVGVAQLSDIEGRSLAPIIKGQTTTHREAIMLSYRDVQRAIRTDQWKLNVYPKINRVQLFDIANDPDELHDLSADAAHADRVKEMLALLAKKQKEMGDNASLRSEKPQADTFTAPTK